MLNTFRLKKVAIGFVMGMMALSSSAQAWDADVHSQVPYQLALRMGFKPEFAEYIAAAGVWPDKSMISGPFLTAHARNRFHFQGQKVLNIVDQKRFDFGGFIDVSQPDNANADAMFMRYLKLGDWEIALPMVHVAMDKLPHSKFLGALGHPEQGHDPDRFWRTPKKFEGSVLQAAQMLAALKKLVPPEYIDETAALKLMPTGNRADLDNPFLVTKLFLKDVEHIYKKDWLKDPEYVKAGVKFFFESLRSYGFVDPNVNLESVLPDGFKLDGTQDIRETLINIVLKGQFMKDREGHELFHFEKLMAFVFPEHRSFADVLKRYRAHAKKQLIAEETMQSPTGIIDAKRMQEIEEQAKMDGDFAVASRAISYLAQGHITEPTGDGNNYINTLEAQELRDFEMNLRVAAFQTQSLRDFNTAISFDPDLVRGRKLPLQILSKIVSSKGFDESAKHETGLADPRVKVVKMPWPTRYRWMTGAGLILFTKLDYLRSQEYQRGALDYEDLDLFKEMIDEGKVPKKSAAQIHDMITDTSRTKALLDRVFGWLEGKPQSEVEKITNAALKSLGQNPDAPIDVTPVNTKEVRTESKPQSPILDIEARTIICKEAFKK